MNEQILYIKDIVENEYGITNPEAYIEYKKQKYANGITLDEVNKLSPDTVDSGSFWRYVEEHSPFNRDAVAYGYKDTDDIEKINRHNYSLACSIGVLNYVFMYMECPTALNILDIGAGYGMLKDFVHKYTKFNYYGVDVWPKIDGIYKVKDCILPKEVIEQKFHMIIATNVFQHLSVRQRLRYYEQIHEMLYDISGSVFSVSHVYVNENDSNGFKCVDNNKKYACHYGQYTEIQTFKEVEADIQKYFRILAVSFRTPNNATFHCIKKESI